MTDTADAFGLALNQVGEQVAGDEQRQRWPTSSRPHVTPSYCPESPAASISGLQDGETVPPRATLATTSEPNVISPAEVSTESPWRSLCRVNAPRTRSAMPRCPTRPTQSIPRRTTAGSRSDHRYRL